MDLVSNFAGSISPSMFGENKQGISPNIDIEDNTFENLLEKQMNKEAENNINLDNNSAFPTGINIADLMSISSPQPILDSENRLDAIQKIGNTDNTDFFEGKDTKDMSTSEILTFFNSLFDNKPSMTDSSNSNLFNFEYKVAAGNYDKYAKNIITDIQEFVTDTMKRKL